jgi:hypothetical protein
VYYTATKDNSAAFAIFFDWPDTDVIGDGQIH